MLYVRAGAGGDEAGIWVGDLLRMYQRYSQGQGWNAKMVSYTEADAGGYKEVIVQVCSSQSKAHGAKFCGASCVSSHCQKLCFMS